jgi:hypothetical protein
MEKLYPLIFVLLFVFSACDEQIESQTSGDETGELSGSWLLYERGYSPGAGYVTEDVPRIPPQIITFKENRISSTISNYQDFKYYQIQTDTVTSTQFVAFHENELMTDSGPTYSFSLRGDTLKLYFRYCFEGCHLAFKKIE